ncbi:hypothetical protein D3C76_143590 [compost metagenome]
MRSIEPETRIVEKGKKYRVEHSLFDVQFEQRGPAIDGFTKVDELGYGRLFQLLVSGHIDDESWSVGFVLRLQSGKGCNTALFVRLRNYSELATY